MTDVSTACRSDLVPSEEAFREEVLTFLRATLPGQG